MMRMVRRYPPNPMMTEMTADLVTLSGQVPAVIGEAGVMDAWLDLLGRLHPLMVHFPLALVIVAAMVELWRAMRRHDGPSPFAVTSVWFAAVGGVGAACSGWANAAFGGESTSVDLFLHRWGGVSVAALLVALAITGTTASRAGHTAWSGLWRMGLVLCAGIVAAVGHFGGNLVHGEGYVTRALWTALRVSQQGTVAPAPATATEPAAPVPATATEPAAPATEASVVVAYSDLLPLFEARCFDCHGRGKSKAGIRLDEPATLVGKDRKGRIIVKPGDPEASSLLTVLTLPEDDDLAMPPEGDRLSAAEIAKVRAWIAAGAPLPAAAGD
jgi:mono/diheme cytochrome c family protein